MKTPRERLESLLGLLSGKCAIRECSDLAIVAYEMEKQRRVKVTPQIGDSNTYKMIVVTRL